MREKLAEGLKWLLGAAYLAVAGGLGFLFVLARGIDDAAPIIMRSADDSTQSPISIGGPTKSSMNQEAQGFLGAAAQSAPGRALELIEPSDDENEKPDAGMN